MGDDEVWVRFAAALVVLESSGKTWEQALDNVVRGADYMLLRYRERFDANGVSPGDVRFLRVRASELEVAPAKWAKIAETQNVMITNDDGYDDVEISNYGPRGNPPPSPAATPAPGKEP